MSKIEVIALKPFVYSEDGYTEIAIEEKQVFQAPERFFIGWNDARYVRRATIGDGKVSLKPSAEEIAKKVEPIVDTAMKLKDTLVTIAETGKLPEPKTEMKPLTDDEQKKLDSGEWTKEKFFWKRSVAYKLGAEVVTNGEDATAAIEAWLAARD